MKDVLKFLWLILLFSLLGTGCASIQRQTPSMSLRGLNIEGNFERKDFIVLGSVEGTSVERSIAGGLVKKIDGNWQILGIPFYEETYSITTPSQSSNSSGGIFSNATPEDRAYYDALVKTPDADFILPKTFIKEIRGIPIIDNTTTVTFQGKSVRIRTD